MRIRLIGLAVAIGAVAAAAAGVYWYQMVERAKGAGDGGTPAAIAVKTVEVGTGTAVDRLTAVGTLYAQFKVDVTPPEAGHIDAIPVLEGAAVAEGDTLLMLDAVTQTAALEDAKAQLELETEKFDRAKALSGRGFAAQSQLDEARAGVIAARSTLARAQAEVDHRTFKAPFAGRIGRTNYDVGAYVQPGDVVMTLRSTEVLYVDFHIPGSLVGRVRPGAVFTATIDGVGKPVEGVVSFIDPEIKEVSRSIELRGEMPNGDGVLRPGMFARLVLTLAERSGALMIPEDALVYELTGRFVYRIRDGKAERVAVEVGAMNDGTAEILSGLSAGDAVVTDGRFEVRDGSPVKVVAGRGPGTG